ncbi:hypothetical protein MyNCGM683_07200 [Achromobacter xylosoxidans]
MDRMNLDHDACYSAIRVRDARYDGRFFTAVKTTRIYCRPVCPARTPLSRNVIFYPTAAAAQEAGFHPCLRCRPETAPAAGRGRDLPDGVARALGLIELGALDDAGVDALAARLGVGERQLRRQFRQHLGASPVAVAQTRRVLLAKQLIHETRLPMAEIAFAAGFCSIRRFNEIFLALFGRAPGELRRSGKPDVPAGPQGEIKLLLRYRPPYDWPAMLDFLRVRAIPGIERVTDDSYTRTIGLDGGQGTVRVEPGPGNALRATVRFPQLHALPTIIARLRRVFDLASDPAALAAQRAAYAPPAAKKDQSRKFSNCNGKSTSVFFNNAIAVCRSSRFLPLIRSLSPLIWLSTLSLAFLIAAISFLATGCSIPCFTVIFCRAPPRFSSGSATSRQRTSIPRADSRPRRMSSICLSWNALDATCVTTKPSSSNLASVPLKSKRVASSRLAWSMALVSSCLSTSETTSKVGMTLGPVGR